MGIINNHTSNFGYGITVSDVGYEDIMVCQLLFKVKTVLTRSNLYLFAKHPDTSLCGLHNVVVLATYFMLSASFNQDSLGRDLLSTTRTTRTFYIKKLFYRMSVSINSDTSKTCP